MIQQFPRCHILQTSEWAEVKQEIGWQSKQMTWNNDDGQIIAAANVLIRTIRPLRIGPKLAVGYIPRGPLLDWQEVTLRRKILTELEQFARKERLVFLKIDPEIILGTGIEGTENSTENDIDSEVLAELIARGWKRSAEQIQFRNTAILNLEGVEEDWLKKMKQKSRYNLRLAQRSGVTVRLARENELPDLYHLYAQTAARDNFIIREEKYYLAVWKKFINAGLAEALIAEIEGLIVAGLLLFHIGKKAWYLYGMSSSLHRDKMPNYILQWEAMRLAKSKGCLVYDLWGAPDVFDESDPMYGVYRFKEGLGATVIRTPGALDFPVKSFLYFLYQKLLPRLLSITRWFRRSRLQQEIN